MPRVFGMYPWAPMIPFANMILDVAHAVSNIGQYSTVPWYFKPLISLRHNPKCEMGIVDEDEENMRGWRTREKIMKQQGGEKKILDSWT